ncbi:MAG: hypothetical protein EXQ71_00230 [Acidimicrobiia bacterium]|nr:hypothetical protein [Acidimicrobiia bacterium]
MDTPQRSAVRRTVVPVALGALAMLAALVGPGWLSGAVAVVGALVAGALNPNEPVRAGVLTVALPVIGGLIRVRTCPANDWAPHATFPPDSWWDALDAADLNPPRL